MSRAANRVVRLLGIETPLIQAAIPPAAGPELVAAVGEAGAIGSLATVFKSADEVTGDPGGAPADRQALRREPRGPTPQRGILRRHARGAATSGVDGSGRAARSGRPGPRGQRPLRPAGPHRRPGAGRRRGRGRRDHRAGQRGRRQTAASSPCPSCFPRWPTPSVTSPSSRPAGSRKAAALVLGAKGANLGTRFLASEEATAGEGWKRQIVSAESDQA